MHCFILLGALFTSLVSSGCGVACSVGAEVASPCVSDGTVVADSSPTREPPITFTMGFWLISVGLGVEDWILPRFKGVSIV